MSGATADAALDAGELATLTERVAVALAWIRSRYTIAEIESAVEQGIAPELLDAAIGRVADAIAADVSAEYRAAARRAGDAIGIAADKPGAVDLQTPRMVDRVRANGAALVSGITEEHRAAITEALAVGAGELANPRAVAIAIREGLGLSAEGARWVRSYRRALESGRWRDALAREARDGRSDRTLRRAIMGGKAPTQDQIDGMVARYANNLTAARAETIARTEMLRALHQGMIDAVIAAAEAGDLNIDEASLQWFARIDGRERDTHHDLHGQERPIGEPFDASGTPIRYPGDPAAPARETIRCRCHLRLVFTPGASIPTSLQRVIDAYA